MWGFVAFRFMIVLSLSFVAQGASRQVPVVPVILESSIVEGNDVESVLEFGSVPSTEGASSSKQRGGTADPGDGDALVEVDDGGAGQNGAETIVEDNKSLLMETGEVVGAFETGTDPREGIVERMDSFNEIESAFDYLMDDLDGDPLDVGIVAPISDQSSESLGDGETRPLPMSNEAAEAPLSVTALSMERLRSALDAFLQALQSLTNSLFVGGGFGVQNVADEANRILTSAADAFVRVTSKLTIPSVAATGSRVFAPVLKGVEKVASLGKGIHGSLFGADSRRLIVLEEFVEVEPFVGRPPPGVAGEEFKELPAEIDRRPTNDDGREVDADSVSLELVDEVGSKSEPQPDVGKFGETGRGSQNFDGDQGQGMAKAAASAAVGGCNVELISLATTPHQRVEKYSSKVCGGTSECEGFSGLMDRCMKSKKGRFCTMSTAQRDGLCKVYHFEFTLRIR